jgi:hypothetical protein
MVSNTDIGLWCCRRLRFDTDAKILVNRPIVDLILEWAAFASSPPGPIDASCAIAFPGSEGQRWIDRANLPHAEAYWFEWRFHACEPTDASWTVECLVRVGFSRPRRTAIGQEQTLVSARVRSFECRIRTLKRRPHFDAINCR